MLTLQDPYTPTPSEQVNHKFCHNAFLRETARQLGTRIDVLDALRSGQVPAAISELLCGPECRDQLIGQLTPLAAVAAARRATHESCHGYFFRALRELDMTVEEALGSLQRKQGPPEALEFICGPECHDELIESLRESVVSDYCLKYFLSDLDEPGGPRTIEDVLDYFKLKQGPLQERIKTLIAHIADTPGTELLQSEVTNALKAAVKRKHEPLPKNLLLMAKNSFERARMKRHGTEPLKPLEPEDLPAPWLSEVECRRCGMEPDRLRHRIPQRLRSTDRLLACSVNRRELSAFQQSAEPG